MGSGLTGRKYLGRILVTHDIFFLEKRGRPVASIKDESEWNDKGRRA